MSWNNVDDDDYVDEDDEYTDEEIANSYFGRLEAKESNDATKGSKQNSGDQVEYFEDDEFSDEAEYIDLETDHSDDEKGCLEAKESNDATKGSKQNSGDEIEYLDDEISDEAEYTDIESEHSDNKEEVKKCPVDAAKFSEQKDRSDEEEIYLEDDEFSDEAEYTDIESEHSDYEEKVKEFPGDAAKSSEQKDHSDEEVIYLEDDEFSDEAENADVESEYSEDEVEFIVDEEYSDDDLEEEEVLEHLPALLKAKTSQVAVAENSSMPKAKTNKHEFKLITLRSTDKDYSLVSEMMQKSIVSHPTMKFNKYEIVKIEKVWNTKVYSRFNHYVEHIKEETDNEPKEKRLFHGSPKSHEIVKRGFDERHSSKNGMYGAGVYFAKHSSKSNQYAFGLNAGCGPHGDIGCLQCTRLMMLCRVVLGNVYKCTSAENFAHAPPGYHSVKGSTAGGNLRYPEYIVYRGEQAFPEFLITYKISK